MRPRLLRRGIALQFSNARIDIYRFNEATPSEAWNFDIAKDRHVGIAGFNEATPSEAWNSKYTFTLIEVNRSWLQ